MEGGGKVGRMYEQRGSVSMCDCGREGREQKGRETNAICCFLFLRSSRSDLAFFSSLCRPAAFASACGTG